MRAMISVAEHVEDSLKLICCETLVEIRESTSVTLSIFETDTLQSSLMLNSW